MSLGRPVPGGINQGFLGDNQAEPRGWVKLVAGVYRGWRTIHAAASRVGHVHLALDFHAPEGTPVRAMGSGKIVAQFTDTDGARVIYQEVRVTRLYRYVVAYWHLQPNSYQQKQGTFAPRGKFIARAGHTGNVRPAGPAGAHLHVELWKVLRVTPRSLWWRLAQRLDPRPFLAGKALTSV